MSILGYFLHEFLSIYSYCIIFYVLINILISFGVINQSNQFINLIMNFFYSIVEPILNKFRKIVPNFGNIDITPIILLVIVKTLQYGIIKYSI